MNEGRTVKLFEKSLVCGEDGEHWNWRDSGKCFEGFDVVNDFD